MSREVRAWLLIASSLVAGLPQAARSWEEPLSFRRDVAPILVSRCVGCHNDQKAQGGLNLSTIAGLKKGGEVEGENILVAGDPMASHLVAVVRPDAPIRMPYKLPALPGSVIALLERWVKDGAKIDEGLEDSTALVSLVDRLQVLPKVAGAAARTPVSAVAYLPDGRLAAARGSSVVVLDPKDGRELLKLEEQPGPVQAVFGLPGGQKLLVVSGRAGMFGHVGVWNLETRKRELEGRGHSDSVLGAALSLDGSKLATSSYDRSVLIWDVATLKVAKELKEHTDAVYGVAFTPDGKHVASVSGDRTAKLWDVETGRRLHSFSDARAELYAVACLADGKHVVGAGVDKTLWLWKFEGETGGLVRSAIAHDGPITRLLLGGEPTVLVSAGEDRGIKVWSVPELAPRAAFASQPDWPLGLAFSPDGRGLAVGRFDGSLAVVSLEAPNESGRELIGAKLAETPAAPSQPKAKPELVRNATLGAPSPRGGQRGTTLEVRLNGLGVGQAHRVVFDDPAIGATILPSEKPERDSLRVSVQIGEKVSPGVHQVRVQTPLGTPAAQPFLVWSETELAEAEPNDDAGNTQATPWPAMVRGALDRPGDVDRYRLEPPAGQAVVARLIAGGIGSSLDPWMTLRDAEGRIVAEGRDVVTADASTARPIRLEVADRQLGGSGNHVYFVQVGAMPYATRAFPLGVEAGVRASLSVEGVNLASGDVEVGAESTKGLAPGSVIGVPVPGEGASSAWRLVVGAGPQTVEQEPNESAGTSTVAVPGGVSGRIEQAGDADTFAFEARKGQPVVLEVFGRRLGTRIDSMIELLDVDGRPVPRAVLRPVAETTVAFRDHNASQDRIRLTKWDELAVNDYLLIGRELTRLLALPKNPDDDAAFWSMGGARLGYLGTTPEQHPMDQPIYKVEIHLPGTTFPKGGVAPVELPYQNDDGGPGYGKDSYLWFDPPADGRFQVRVSDAAGGGGPDHAYHLALRMPRPSFEVALGTEQLNVARGGGMVVRCTAVRRDGFEGPIRVSLQGLPTGVTATDAVIEEGQIAADLLVSAADDAPVFGEGEWMATATAEGAGPDHPSSRTIDPAGRGSGWVTVTPRADLSVSVSPSPVVLRPGGRATVKFAVERSEAFDGRVPIDVRNLPFGVRVLNIGLNGVLVTEKERERSVEIYAEPWARPVTRPFYAVGRVEAAGMEASAGAVPLVVEAADRRVSTP